MDKGLKILFKLYGYNSGSHDYILTDEDFNHAKQEGYLFDPAPKLTHNEALEQLHWILPKISPQDVANAFLYSLSTRALHYRSALGSYYYAISIPDHSHNAASPCYFCDWCGKYDLNSLSFDRYKYGGVQHTSLEYPLFDLQQFIKLPKVSPTAGDWKILKAILSTAAELPPKKKAGAYRDLLRQKKLLPTNQYELATLLDILGICGVLSSSAHPCYCDWFPNVYQRAPLENTNDYAYPVNHWHASDGINEVWFEKVFGVPFSQL